MKVLKGFTPEQKVIIDLFGENTYLRDNFYFTGGTALQTAYFQHRKSEDLDFFSETELNTQYILDTLSRWGSEKNFSLESQILDTMHYFFLTFDNGTTLKVDFVNYPHKRLKPSEKYRHISVDSLTDIAVNKVICINQRLDIKDYVDLFFLLDQFSIWDLFEGVRHKFRIKIEPYIFASDILLIDSFTTLPKMLKPLSLTELQGFYKKLAKKLGAGVMA